MSTFDDFFLFDPETGLVMLMLPISDPVLDTLRELCENYEMTPEQMIGLAISFLASLPANPDEALGHFSPHQVN